MLTIEELSQVTGKAESVIRYWIKKDKEFTKMFFKKMTLPIHNSIGYTYYKDMYTCDEADAVKIVEYMKSKKHQSKQLSKWSDIAKHCYYRQVCKGCCFEHYCGEFAYPPLKLKVQELIELYGEPIC